MLKTQPTLAVLAFLALPLSALAQTNSSAVIRLATEGRASLFFTENNGQVADLQHQPRPDILFTAGSRGARVYLSANALTYQLTDAPAAPPRCEPFSPAGRGVADAPASRRIHRLTVSLQDANPAPVVRKEAMRSYTENFYLANCPQGITGVHTYDRVVMQDVYPGIDWVVYSQGSGLEYDFVVHPGADPGRIRLAVADADAVVLDEAGNLEIRTSLGLVRESAPVAACGGVAVPVQFVKTGDAIGFSLAAWDRTSTLVIDPAVTWATYYGGEATDDGHGVAVDARGDVYLAGSTASTAGIASVGGFQQVFGGSIFDAMLVKMSPGGQRIWATYYGGDGEDFAQVCATDAAGHLYLAGNTGSAGMASGGHQNTFGGASDAFLAQFDTAGLRLWATYYGGAEVETAYGCATDAAGNVYICGDASSPTGVATPGAFQTTVDAGAEDGYLAKFNTAGQRLWGTYYGGAGEDRAYGCATDRQGHVYLSGWTTSTTGIAQGGFQNTFGGGTFYDAFLVKFDTTGNRLWGTYCGGPGVDAGYPCATDDSGNVYLVGLSESGGGIAIGGFQNGFAGGTSDGFIVKYNAAGQRIWGTYYGGSDVDWANGCYVDKSGNLYICGYSGSPAGIATPGAPQTVFGGGLYDAFIARFTTAGARIWGTYLGGPAADAAYAIAGDGTGRVYMAGSAGSTSGVATANGYQPAFGGGFRDAFLVLYQDTIQMAPSVIAAAPGLATAFQMYPNPGRGVFELSASGLGQGPVHITVTDALGRCLYAGEAQPASGTLHTHIDLGPAVVPGIYGVRVAAGSLQQVSQLVVQP